MKQRKFFIGPGAASLLLVIVVVSMSILGLLALMSARSDAKLMDHSREFVAAEYQTAASAERKLAELDGIALECALAADDDAAFLEAIARNLPEDMTMDGRIISWIEPSNVGRTLNCGVRVSELGATPRLSWQEHFFLTETDGQEF